ncbi:VOC family protein [Alteromonas flava]|uniref:SMU1112c/YaeR family gloxylase I-like metalloprotein n=1 Tax=Alteromonas flava TaxID=2048003 RepID=UPI000C2902B9|nr:VOC family protein [Alteromonas flava]
MISGIHHVAIICSDYARSKAFYCNVVGCKVLAENYRAERNSYKLDLALPGGGQIELFSFPNPPPRPSSPEAQGLRHLAFATENIQSAIENLLEHGVAVEEVRVDPYTNQKFTFFRDPDDLPLELYEVAASDDCQK